MNQKILLTYLVACFAFLNAWATEPTPPGINTANKFVINKGQIDERNAPTGIRYYFHRGPMSVYFLEDRISYVLTKPHEDGVISNRIDLSFGGTTTPKIFGAGEISNKNRYYTMDCPEGVTAEDYSKVIYQNVYDNIDLVYYFDKNGSLKYDFVVHPGGNPQDINLTFNGDADISVSEEGNLVVKSAGGEINEAAPYTFLKGNNQEVSSKFILNKNILQFEIGDYNEQATLIIDPEVKWSTFYGGDSFDDGIGNTTDNAGNLYVVGQTFSLEFPNIDADYGNGERGDIVIGKFSPTGEHLWTIYYGGDAESRGRGITFDELGNAYAVGFTMSKFLPNPEDASNPIEASGNEDIVVLKVDADGNPLRVRTYGSFNGKDEGEEVAYDGGGLYITGHTSTNETEFANLINGTEHQPVKAQDVDAFLMRIDSDMNPIWFTYLGGSGGDEAYGLTVDDSGNPYITGATSSPNLPTSGNAFTPGTTAEETDVFIAKFNQADGSLLWLNYLGGNHQDVGQDLVTYEDEIVYVVGETASRATDGFEIVGNDTLVSYQENYGGGVFDAFALRLDATTGAMVWSTYLGGSNDDRAYSVATTNGAEVIITGYTESPDYPTANNDEAVRADFQGGEEDAYLTVLSDAGTIRYSGFIGGSNIDLGRDVAFHRPTESVYIVGRTRSADFPTIGNSYQPEYNGGADIFIYTISAIIDEDEQDPDPDPDEPNPSPFCDNVLNNVISENPLFVGGCIDQINDIEVFFYGTTPTIADGTAFSYQYQIYVDGRWRSIPGATDMNLTVGDIDLENYPPGFYFIRRLVITEACVDASSTEVLDYELFDYAFANFSVQANCAGEDIMLINESAISDTNIGTDDDITSYTYTVVANGTTQIFNEPNPNIGTLPEGTAQVTLDITSEQGCVGSMTKTIEIGAAAQASFEYENDVICLNYPYQFTSTSTSDAEDPIVNYSWDFGNGMESSEQNPVVEFTQAGAKTITLTIETQNGCSDVFSQTFNNDQVVPEPMVDAGIDQTIKDGSVVRFDPEVSFPSTPVAQSYGSSLWTSNPEGAFDEDSFDPTVLDAGARPREDTWFNLMVTSNLGCVAEDSLLVTVTPDDSDPNIPDLFTPNDDGYNDFFEIPFLEDFPDATVKIFNRWGSLIYETTNYSENPWDGTYDGEPAPTGVYFYIISFPDGRNEIEGTITLLR